jgi:hypothetical protein
LSELELLFDCLLNLQTKSNEAKAHNAVEQRRQNKGKSMAQFERRVSADELVQHCYGEGDYQNQQAYV